MKTLAILAAIVALAIAMLVPHNAHAKAKGDTIGAPINTTMTGAAMAKLNAVDAPPTATTTHKLTRMEKRARIAELKREIRVLKAELKKLTK